MSMASPVASGWQSTLFARSSSLEDRTMIRLALVLLAIPLVCRDLPAQSRDRIQEWEQKESKDGRYSIKWPPGKVRHDSKSLSSQAGTLTLKTDSITVKDGPQLAVTFNDYPFGNGVRTPQDAERLLTAVRDGMKMTGSVLESSRQPEGFGGQVLPYPGLEFTYRHGKFLARTRLFLIQSRMYQVTAMGLPSEVNSRESELFLLSFNPKK